MTLTIIKKNVYAKFLGDRTPPIRIPEPAANLTGKVKATITEGP